MEKKYLKPEIELMDLVAEQDMLAGSAIDAELTEDTQDNEDALMRSLGINLPFEF